MADLQSANFSTVQSNLQPLPATVTAAASITPTTFLTILSGTTAVATIVAPVTGTHMLAIVAGTTTAAFTTSGNITGVTTASTTAPTLLIYNPITGKYLMTV